MFKSYGWWPTGFYCQPQAPFGTDWVLELIGTLLGFGLRGLGTKGLGPGLDILFSCSWSYATGSLTRTFTCRINVSDILQRL